MKILVVLFWMISLFSTDTNETNSATLTAADTDCETPSTYEGNIKGILATYCMDAGCHNGGDLGPGNFGSYKGLSKYIKKNTIEERVLQIGNMPPEYSDGPTELSDEAYSAIKCWIEAGYPEE